ncbi:MAG: DUF4159 domain-containing protein, partial [Alphaproteobacteria bacterium]|nr:DUF4159 domain-containing protein [Alphaproteobacteria bacterium]
DLPRPAEAVWLSDGFNHGDVRALAETLQRLGALQILREGSARLARFLPAPRNEPSGLVAVVRRPPIAEEEDLWIRAIAENGNVVGREKAHFASGAGEASAVFGLPGEIRNRITRLEIDGHAAAGATVLVDERWRRRPVGLVSGGPADTAQPLLADTYYLNRALAPFAEVREGPLATLLERPLSILALADVGQIVGDERQILERWLQNGGVLVRFAGPRLAESADDLVPTKLRGGGRTLEGALQWAQPAALAPFPPESPFAGLSIPDEVTVRRQVLAEPMPDLGRKTWARLADGTPLVTAEPRGKGWLVLFHTTANTTWSNLPISGLFVEMLQRLVALGQGVAGQDAAGLLAPIASLDGFGRVVPPLAAAVPATAETLATKPPSPRQPPGFYGKEGYRLAYNATSGLASLKPLGDMPSGVVSRAYAGDREVELKRWLILAALMLIFVDLLASFALRGLIRLPLAAASLLLLLAPLWPGPARADDAFVKAATQNTRLAYVRTGLADVDRMSHAGLVGLSDVLARRTSVESDQPLGVDVESDDLMFFPLLYWPIVPEQRDLSPRALAKIDAFMKTGGTILFDTRDQAQVVPMGQGGGPGAQRLRRLLNRLDIPPLRPVPPDHVLTKAFYL